MSSRAVCLAISIQLCGTLGFAVERVEADAPLAAATPSAAVSTPKLDRLIAELDADEFSVREKAGQALTAVGVAAVDPLARAARSPSLEQVHRSLGILERFLSSGDEALSEAAENALRELAGRQSTWAAQRAETALAQVRGLRQEASYRKLKSLGAESIAEANDEHGEMVYISLAIREETWKGTAKDFRLLRNLPAMKQLSLFGPIVPNEEWKKLGELQELQALNLYGTKLDDVGLTALQAALPYARIDRRNGGMLGISGDLTVIDGCVVERVQPDSAAAAAGIEPQDQILSIDGKKIAGFPDLTKLVSEKSGGDKVDVVVKRGNKTLEKQVVLGIWKPEHLKGIGGAFGGGQIILQNGQQIIIGR